MKILAGVEEVTSEEKKDLLNDHVCNNHHEKNSKTPATEDSTKSVAYQVNKLKAILFF